MSNGVRQDLIDFNLLLKSSKEVALYYVTIYSHGLCCFAQYFVLSRVRGEPKGIIKCDPTQSSLFMARVGWGDELWSWS